MKKPAHVVTTLYVGGRIVLLYTPASPLQVPRPKSKRKVRHV